MTEKLHWEDVTIEGLTDFDRLKLDGMEDDEILEYQIKDVLLDLIASIDNAQNTLYPTYNESRYNKQLKHALTYVKHAAIVMEYLVKRGQSDYEF